MPGRLAFVRAVLSAPAVPHPSDPHPSVESPVMTDDVADSIPEMEWLETENKARAVLRAAEQVQDGLDGEI